MDDDELTSREGEPMEPATAIGGPEPSPMFEGWPPPPPLHSTSPETDPRPRRGRAWLAAILACLVLLGGGIGIGWGLGRRDTTVTTTTSESPLKPVPQASPSAGQPGNVLSTQAIADKVSPAVVDINTLIGGFDGSGSGSNSVPSGGRGAGTGVILTSTGEILTNNHVIAGATSIRVTIAGHSGTSIAKVIGADPTDDVALLQIQGVSGLPTVTVADSSTLSVGQRVVAIGNALGRGGAPTVTEGNISALNQDITAGNDRGGSEHLTNVIQTDAAIVPGDSGGALVNGSGQVVGMISAGSARARVQQASHIGFAIPSNGALRIVNEMRAGHSSSTIILGQPGFLGVEVEALDAATAARLGLGVTSGALVAGVIAGTPAARAGISQPAVITAIDGKAISSVDDLGPAIYTHQPGQRIKVTWVDGSGTHTATVTLIAGPAV